MKRKLHIGIWGLGRSGWGMHANEIDRYPEELCVAAGYDIDPERTARLKTRYPDCRVYADEGRFLADPDIDVVSVAVRSPDHADFALRALEKGKTVFLEKPVSVCPADIMKLEEALKRYPGKLFFRHNRRFESAFNHVREIVDSGVLGNVWQIKLCRHGFSYREDWQALRSCGGGQLNNWGPHIIDHALRLLDSPVAELWSRLENINGLGDAEDTVKAVFIGENGRMIDLEIGGGEALPGPVYAVYGDRGALICEDEQDIRLRYLSSDSARPARRASEATPPADGSFQGNEKQKWIRKTIMVEPSNGYTVNDIYHHLYLALREGVPFPVKPEEALEVARTIEKIKRQNPAFYGKTL